MKIFSESLRNAAFVSQESCHMMGWAFSVRQLPLSHLYSCRPVLAHPPVRDPDKLTASQRAVIEILSVICHWCPIWGE